MYPLIISFSPLLDQPITDELRISHTANKATQDEIQRSEPVAYQESESVSELVEPDESYTPIPSHEVENSTPMFQNNETRAVEHTDFEISAESHRPRVFRPLPSEPAANIEDVKQFSDEQAAAAAVTDARSPPPIKGIPEPPARPARRSIPPPVRPPPPVINLDPRISSHKEDVEDSFAESGDEGQEGMWHRILFLLLF